MNPNMIWMVLLIVILAVMAIGILWMASAVCRFSFLRGVLPQGKWRRMACGVMMVTLVMLVLYLTMDLVNMIMVYLHLLIIWLLCDGIAAVVRRTTGRTPVRYYSGLCAIAITAVWLAIGWYNAHHVVRTTYDIHPGKDIGVDSMKIVALSDSHVGATFHWQLFEDYVDRINEEHPDMVVIAGDFVDDDTQKEDMVHCCKALGRLRTRYGVFFIYGNHDEGYWNDNGRGYTLADLDRHLVANGVKILHDSTAHIAGRVYLCGRLDKSRSRDRMPAHDLMALRSPQDYVICLDHEPNDYEAETASGMDLVISGHTHGGQFLGLGTLGVMMGANDAYYGYERHAATDFIVSSGIADWAIKFKTGCISEYVVVKL